MYEISKDPISDIFCWLSSFSSMHFLNMEEPLLQKPQRKRFLQSNYYRRKIFDASLLLLQKRVFGGTDLLSVSFKSLAIVLCVFISCFSIQFFCLEKKREQGWDGLPHFCGKQRLFFHHQCQSSIFIVKRTVLANSARLSQWEAKCVHDYSKISEALELRSTFLGKHIYVFIPFRICNGLRQFHLG